MLFDILCHIVLCKYLAVCLFGGMTRKDSPGGREYAAKTRANGQKLRDVRRGRVALSRDGTDYCVFPKLQRSSVIRGCPGPLSLGVSNLQPPQSALSKALCNFSMHAYSLVLKFEIIMRQDLAIAN
jgi:hypothetical protein